MTLFSDNVPYRHLKPLRTVFYGGFMLILFLISLVVMPLNAHAGTHTVENIKVDVTAKNAVEAREKAFEQAQVKGYKMLAESLMDEEEFENFEAPELDVISRYVQNFAVTNEQLSAVRYKGVYTIKFSDRAFKNKSGSSSAQSNKPSSSGTSFNDNDQELIGNKMLVIPFYEPYAGTRVLWNGENPFKSAWQRYARKESGLIDAVLPSGSQEDMAQITDSQSVNFDPAALNAMRIRYRASELKLLVAMPQPSQTGKDSLLVKIYKPQSWGPELIRQFSVQGQGHEGTVQLFDRAVSETAYLLAANSPRTASTSQVAPTRQKLVMTGPTKTIRASLNFTSVKEWVQTKASLDRAQGIKSVRVQSMSPKAAMLDIAYFGNEAQLRNVLQQVGLLMENPMTQYSQNNAGGVYQLYSASSTQRY